MQPLAKTRRLPYLRRESLKRLALAFDLEPEGDYMKSGNRPVEQAFHLIQCGFDLTVPLSRRGFPALGLRTRRRGAKYGTDGLIYRAPETSRVLGHVLPGLMIHTEGRLLDPSEQEGAVGVEYHERLARAIEDFFPLGPANELVVETFSAEFKVMETKQPRPEVASGDEVGSAYSQALLRGENPDNDPELVRQQWCYARDFFINRASLKVMKDLLGSDFKLVAKDLTPLGRSTSSKVGAYRARQLAAWIEGSRTYREYALIYSAETPAPEPAAGEKLG